MNKEHVYQRFCPKIQTTKGSKSRFEMTHGRVSTLQTLIYPLLPPPSQSILFSKNNTKNKNKNKIGTTDKAAGRAIQTPHA